MANYQKDFNAYSPLQRKYRTSKFLNLHKKYRSDFEIIALVLESVRDNGVTRFSIMRRAGINCAQLKRYLKSLSEIGFIEMEKREGRAFYGASVRGVEFLKQYYVLLGMLLNAQAASAMPGSVYETEYYAPNRRLQPATPIVARLQHDP